MIFEFVKDLAKLVLIGSLMWLLLRGYIRWKRPHLADAVGRHRWFICLILGAVIVGIDVSEDALTGDSGPVDKAILLFVHSHVPSAFTGFFGLATLTGSFECLIILLTITSLVFLLLKKRFEAVLLAGSGICGALVIYGLKALTGRERPALWETRWYWGTSFPSGHTLETACFATALTLSVSRVWPGKARWVRLIALGWVVSVGFSRLVLGVHWPTDVLAAVCIGMLLAVTVQFLLLRFRGPRARLP
jgi:undecaprenyl-diphosphatase